MYIRGLIPRNFAVLAEAVPIDKHLEWETMANRSTLFKQLVGYILITCSKTTYVQENQTC